MVTGRFPSLKLSAVSITLLCWLGVTWLFWIGYVGSDDMVYSRYAYLLHRPPINWWEFRIPSILAIRAAFSVLGPTELAAALPTLLSTAAIMVSVAWFVGWPSRLDWQTQSAMLIAVTFPLDVSFRSVPGASFFAGGFLALGTACMLKGSGKIPFMGSVLLIMGFAAHEVSVFYVGIVCLAALAVDFRRFIAPVAVCILIGLCTVAIESITYYVLLGEPLARLQTAAGTTTSLPIGYDPDTGLHGFRFFTWPLENLVYCRQFGFDLGLLFLAGCIAWKRLDDNQRILFLTALILWFWLGFGTQVPWAYKTFYRQMHYYSVLTLSIAVLLPATLRITLQGRERTSGVILGAAIMTHLVSLGAGGRWGQEFDVSRDLLNYARAHPQQTFLTDIATMNEMYVLEGFRLPENVIALNGPALRHLLVNKEPAGTPVVRFPERDVDAILVNRELISQREPEKEFTTYLKEHPGRTTEITPVAYRLIFVPLARFVENTRFAILSAGGEVVTF